MTTKILRFEKTLALRADPARVFAALTEPRELETWFAEHVRVEPRVGGLWAFWGTRTAFVPSESDATQTITVFQPGEVFGFDWTWLSTPTHVTLTLQASGQSTDVTVRHEAERTVGPFSDVETPFVMGDFWVLSLRNLDAYLRTGRPALIPDHAQEGDVVVSVEIDAPPSTVWALLTTPDGLDRWLSQKANIELAVGGRYDYGWEFGNDCVGPQSILELEHERKLVHDWFHKGQADGRTEWTLEPLGEDRTRVTIRQIGKHSPTDASGYINGWGKFLLDLKAVAQGEAVRTADDPG